MKPFYYQWPPPTSTPTAAVGDAGPDELSALFDNGELSHLRQRLRLVSTTRQGGVSAPPFDSLNLGTHVGDDPQAVATNRRRLIAELDGSPEPAWLTQVHGTRCVDAAHAVADGPVEADAAVVRKPGLAAAIMTADCLPVVFIDRKAQALACAHAGWRGLASGIIESTLEALAIAPARFVVWLGPAIGPDKFEVGPEVRQRFLESDPGAEHCFSPSPFTKKSRQDTRLVADLYELARRRLRRAGIDKIAGGTACTYSDDAHFFSYRRDGQTGRMATLAWLRSPDSENRQK